MSKYILNIHYIKKSILKKALIYEKIRTFLNSHITLIKFVFVWDKLYIQSIM